MAPYFNMKSNEVEAEGKEVKRDYSSIINLIGNSETAKTKKRRRGDAEKKRRDRINRCLDQLEDLIPYVKQKKLCSKVDKAEVLELTVQYIKETLTQRETSTRSTRPYERQSWGSSQTKTEYNRYRFEDQLNILTKMQPRGKLCRCGCGKLSDKLSQHSRALPPSRVLSPHTISSSYSHSSSSPSLSPQTSLPSPSVLTPSSPALTPSPITHRIDHLL